MAEGNFSIAPGEFIMEQTGNIREKYRIGSKIGDGAFGSVRRVTYRQSGEVRAVKTIHKKSLRTEEEKRTFFGLVEAQWEIFIWK